MPRYSDERLKQIDAMIRSAIVRNPNISGETIAEQLKYDKDFVYKRINKIRKKMAYEIDHATLHVFLMDFVNKANEVMIEMWRIIGSKDSRPADKVNAGRTIVITQKEVFEKLFDAGIFTRKLGEITEKGLANETLSQFLSTYQSVKQLPEVKNAEAEKTPESKTPEKN